MEPLGRNTVDGVKVEAGVPAIASHIGTERQSLGEGIRGRHQETA